MKDRGWITVFPGSASGCRWRNIRSQVAVEHWSLVNLLALGLFEAFCGIFYLSLLWHIWSLLWHISNLKPFVAYFIFEAFCGILIWSLLWHNLYLKPFGAIYLKPFGAYLFEAFWGYLFEAFWGIFICSLLGLFIWSLLGHIYLKPFGAIYRMAVKGRPYTTICPVYLLIELVNMMEAGTMPSKCQNSRSLKWAVYSI